MVTICQTTRKHLSVRTEGTFRPFQKVIQDSGFDTVDFAFQVLDSGLLVSGTWIPDSLGKMTDFKAKDFRFHEQNFPGFRILEAEISRISEIRMTLHGEKYY